MFSFLKDKFLHSVTKTQSWRVHRATNKTVPERLRLWGNSHRERTVRVGFLSNRLWPVSSVTTGRTTKSKELISCYLCFNASSAGCHSRFLSALTPRVLPSELRRWKWRGAEKWTSFSKTVIISGAENCVAQWIIGKRQHNAFNLNDWYRFNFNLNNYHTALEFQSTLFTKMDRTMLWEAKITKITEYETMQRVTKFIEWNLPR